MSSIPEYHCGPIGPNAGPNTNEGSASCGYYLSPSSMMAVGCTGAYYHWTPNPVALGIVMVFSAWLFTNTFFGCDLGPVQARTTAPNRRMTPRWVSFSTDPPVPLPVSTTSRPL